MLKGLTTQVSGVRTVFMGHRADLEAQFADSLIGKAGSERWYRVELPEPLMPGATDVSTIDLSKNAAIRFVFNLQVLHPAKDQWYWRTIDVTSASGALTGTLELTGSAKVKSKMAITDAKEYVGVGIECDITQTFVLPDVVLHNSQGHFSVGVVAGYAVSTSSPRP